MAVDCSKIAGDVIAAECDKLAIAGTQSRVILINYSDIDRGESVVTGNVISMLVLKDGARAYYFDSLDNSTVGTVGLNAGTYRKFITHSLAMRIFTKDQDVKDWVNSFVEARVVAVVENKETGKAGEVTWEAYGWDSGLELTDLTGTTEMTDGIVYELTVASGTVSQERQLPKSVWYGSIAATQTALNNLVTPPVTP